MPHRGIRVRIVGKRYANLVEEIVSELLGKYHGYYAAYSLETGIALAALLEDCGDIRGVEVFYETSIGVTKLCVHYYIVVRRAFQGRGYGKILVASVEEYCGSSKFFIATTTSDNIRSIRLFESLGYKRYTFEDIEELIGEDEAYELVKATCSFEDDIFLVKPELKSSSIKGEASNNTWRRICLEPWLKLRYNW